MGRRVHPKIDPVVTFDLFVRISRESFFGDFWPKITKSTNHVDIPNQIMKHRMIVIELEQLALVENAVDQVGVEADIVA